MSLAELEACVEEQKIKVGDPGYRFVQTFPTFKGKRGKEKNYLGTVKEILPDGRREIHYSDNDVRFLTLEDVELHSKNFFSSGQTLGEETVSTQRNKGKGKGTNR